MTLGMFLSAFGGICLGALVVNAAANFFLRRSLKRSLKQQAGASPAVDQRKAVRELQRARHLAFFAQQRPNLRGAEIVQLGSALEEVSARKLDVLLRA